MTLRKLTIGEVLAGLSGAGAIALLFGPWFGGDSGWASMTVVLALVLITALLGIFLLVSTVYQRSQAYPVAAEVFGFAFGCVTAVVVLIELLVRTDPGWAAWAGLAAIIGVAAGSWIAMRIAVRPEYSASR
ncbi:MAG: hypothetical protein R2736_17940 [Solirubrobacterales bacterium]